ncbi:ATP-binding protein [Erythrobacter sp. CCH5-A1]|uniref:ATP-binding protein n=1 Tax=Erythrobacter sp. CCH5-A1 TaxID=1768792 RepID=UPI00082C86EA|nr:ATP-binding protein [Erythrobacter sp. CCH5-A1]
MIYMRNITITTAKSATYLENVGQILAEASAATLLIGEAGSGKSALLAKLTEELENQGSTVFGIKADTLPADVATFDDIARALGMTGSLLPELSALARNAPVVLIIDQLDAVSDVMDRTSQRMKVLLRLVRQAQEQRLPVEAAPEFPGQDLTLM